MAYASACRALASKFLDGYQLSPSEREEETTRLAEFIQRCAESELEGLEHRKVITA